MILDWLAAAASISGAAFAALAGVGVVRMPDVYLRMHAATKAGTLGAGLVLVGVAVNFGDLAIIARAAAAIVFLVLTAPVAAHMIGRAAYLGGVPLWQDSVVDQWGLQTAPVQRMDAADVTRQDASP